MYEKLAKIILYNNDILQKSLNYNNTSRDIILSINVVILHL